MMETLGHISEYGLEKLRTRRNYCVTVSYLPEKEFTIGIVRLSDAEARIAELEAENARLKAEREEADHKLVDRYRDPNTGTFSFPGDVAAIVRRLDAAEALLKEVGKAMGIVLGNAKRVDMHNNGALSDIVGPWYMDQLRAIRDKIGVKDE